MNKDEKEKVETIKKEEEREVLDGFKSRLSVDPCNLEIECRDQSVLLEEVGEITAEIKRVSRAAKEHLEYIKADLSTRIRKEPEKYDITKITEGAVASAVVLQPEYQKAVEEMLDAMEHADTFSTLLIAVEQRKSLIKDAVSLYIHEYYLSQKLTGEEQNLGKVTEEQIAKKRLENAEKQKRLEDSEI